MAMNPRLLVPRASFDPRSIAGLGLWLDASVNSSLTFNGSTVSEWRDLSGNGRDFNQATSASQPGTRTLGTKQALDFGGSAWLNGVTAAQNIARNVAGLTIFVAGQLDSIAQPQTFVNISRDGSTTQARAILTYDSSSSSFLAGGRRLDSDSFQSIVSAGSGAAGTVVLSAVYDYAASDLFLYVTGAITASTASFQTNGNTSDTDSDVVNIGQTASASGFLDGAIGEILIFRNALSDSDRQRIEGYLAWKWS